MAALAPVLARTSRAAETLTSSPRKVWQCEPLLKRGTPVKVASPYYLGANSAATPMFSKLSDQSIPLGNADRERCFDYCEQPSRLADIVAAPLQTLNAGTLFGRAPDSVCNVSHRVRQLFADQSPIHIFRLNGRHGSGTSLLRIGPRGAVPPEAWASGRGPPPLKDGSRASSTGPLLWVGSISARSRLNAARDAS
jgi:hypothetical protein